MGGFPIKFSKDGRDAIFSKVAVVKMIAFFTISYLNKASFLILGLCDWGQVDMARVWKNYPLGVIDFYVSTIPSLFTNVLSIVILYLFAKHTAPIKTISSKMVDLWFRFGSVSTLDGCTNNRHMLIFMTMISGMSTVAFIVAVMEINNIIFPDNKCYKVKIMLSCLGGIDFNVTSLGPVVTSVSLFSGLFLHTYAIIVHTWSHLVMEFPSRLNSTSSKEGLKLQKSYQFKYLLQAGNDISEIGKLVNTALSPFLLCVYITYLMNGIAYLFLASGIFFMKEGVVKINALSSVSGGLISVVYLISIFWLSRQGQLVKNEFIAASDVLHKTSSKLEKYLELDRWAVEVLVKQLEKGGEISPYDLFMVNSSGYLSMVSYLLTYIIVLMQFKAA